MAFQLSRFGKKAKKAQKGAETWKPFLQLADEASRDRECL